MTKDMTQGSPLSLILRFAFPLLLGNLLQQTYNMIDAAIVGQYLGPRALAGVGASSSVQFLVLGLCIGTCSGIGIPIARDFGAGHPERLRSDLFHSALLIFGLACVITTICAILCPQILHLLSAPQDIFSDAYAYLLIIFLGIPFTMLYNFFSSVLRAIGDSRTPFVFLAISAGLNILLDLFCIMVLGWGCAGAAIATIASQAISGISCMVFAYKKFPLLHLQKEDMRFYPGRLAEISAMALPMGLQFSVTAIGSMVMQSANNSLGSVFVSGFTAAMRIKQLTMCPFDALSTGVSVFTSQNMGAGKPDRILQGLNRGLIVAIVYGLLIGTVLILFGRPLSLLFISRENTDVLDASGKYLRYLGFFYWSLGMLNVARLCVQGLGYSIRAIFSGIAEMIARSLVCTIFVSHWGYTAICCADQAAWIAACLYIVPMAYLSVHHFMKKHNLAVS